jgi:hypothetical protein
VTIARLAVLALLAGVLFAGDESKSLARPSPYANLGVLDGIVRSVDGRGMFIDVHIRTGGIVLQRIDFGPHMIFGAGGIATTRADVVSGRAIGVLIQRQPVGPVRAMRVWLD